MIKGAKIKINSLLKEQNNELLPHHKQKINTSIELKHHINEIANSDNKPTLTSCALIDFSKTIERTNFYYYNLLCHLLPYKYCKHINTGVKWSFR